MSDKDIIEQIKREIEEITKTENFPDAGKGFVFWVLKNYFDLEDETAHGSLIDSPNDKRVDAFVEQGENIKVVQCKFFEDPAKMVGGNEIVLFKGCLDWLRRPDEVKRLGLPRFYDASLTFSEAWEDGVEAQLHFFAFGKFSSEAEDEQIVFNNSDLKERVQIHFHDIEDILAIWELKFQEENPLAKESIRLELTQGEYFVRKGEIPSIVATIRGNDLLTMYKKYGDRLFERNIRFYRGAGRGSINAKIVDTILDADDQENFWYYNNGISFVCQDFSINADSDPPILEVQGFQVINGCQTTVCLSEARKRASNWADIPQGVQILSRFIKAPVREVDLITLYTNSQNPVSEMQLKSNCPIQKRLKDELTQYSPPYFYSIKEGDWRRLSAEEKNKFGDRTIGMPEAAQAVYSFTADPAFARRWRNRLFTEKYHEIFRKDIKVEEIILPWRILKAIDKEIAKYRREEFNRLKKEPNSFTEDERDEVLGREFLLYSNLIILHFIGRLIQKQYKQYTSAIAQKLLNNQLEGRVGRIFKYIESILKFSDKLRQETNLSRFLKNSENIATLYNEIQRAMQMESARTKRDPLIEMLPQI